MLRSCRFLGVLLVCGWLSGCGDGGSTPEGLVKVTGKLVKGGKPLEVSTGAPPIMVQIALLKAGEAAGGATVRADESGAFATELAPGTYKFAVTHVDQGATVKMNMKSGRPPSGAGMTTMMDRLQGAFSHDKTQITITVPEGASHDVGTIDLDDKSTWKK